jgi:creatinine amidohydrolase
MLTGGEAMPTSLDKIRYGDLTWPEINEAAEAKKVVLLPVGSIEQHGPHLTLDVDTFVPEAICLKAAERARHELLVMPAIPYGYNEHAQDFPGTIHITHETFMRYCIDVVKSVAYAGFDRIVIVDGHGSNEHLCEFIARRGTLETDALVASTLWANLSIEAFERVRESGFGGAAHACEFETSALLYLRPEQVQMDKAEDHYGGATQVSSRFLGVDLTRGWGAVKLVGWTSGGTPSGISGAPSMATAEKGKVVVEAAIENLVAFAREFRKLQKATRVDHRAVRPQMPRVPSGSVAAPTETDRGI